MRSEYMTYRNTSYVYFDAQIGDTYADLVCDPHFKALRAGLNKYCSEPYSDEVDEFFITVRVEGDFNRLNFEGCRYLRLVRKKRYIAIDIGIPKNRWDGVEPVEFRRYLIKHFEEALKLMVKNLSREDMSVDSEKLFQDFAEVEEEFLKQKMLINH
jgi:hypothetical protein